MDKILKQINYRYILVDSYKNLGLNENDLAVLLVTDNILKEEPMLVTNEISVELTLAVPKSMAIGEFQKWLKESFIEVNRLVPTDKEKLINKVKVLQINNKGSK